MNSSRNFLRRCSHLSFHRFVRVALIRIAISKRILKSTFFSLSLFDSYAVCKSTTYSPTPFSFLVFLIHFFLLWIWDRFYKEVDGQQFKYLRGVFLFWYSLHSVRFGTEFSDIAVVNLFVSFLCLLVCFFRRGGSWVSFSTCAQGCCCIFRKVHSSTSSFTSQTFRSCSLCSACSGSKRDDQWTSIAFRSRRNDPIYWRIPFTKLDIPCCCFVLE